MATPLKVLPGEVLREFRARPGRMLMLSAIIGYSILLWSFLQPESYVSEASLSYQGSEESPKSIALERLGQPGAVVGLWEKNGFSEGDNRDDQAQLARELKRRIQLESEGPDRLLLSYSAGNAREALVMTRDLSRYLARPVAVEVDVPSEEFARLNALVQKEELRLAEAGSQLKAFQQQNSGGSALVVLRKDMARIEESLAEVSQRMDGLSEQRDALQNSQGIDQGPQNRGDRIAAMARLNRQIEAISDEKRALQVELANRRAEFEKVDAKSAEESALTRELESATQSLRQAMAQRDALQSVQSSGEAYLFRLVGSASPPVTQEVFGFRQYAVLGLLVGLFGPVVLLALACLLDPRVRSPGHFTERTGIAVLSEVPVLESPFERRLARSRRWTYLTLAFLGVALYLYLAWLRMNGIF